MVELVLRQLNTSVQLSELERGELDLGFMTQVQGAGLRSLAVAHDRINVVLPTGHPLAVLDGVPLRLLEGETLLFRTREVAPAAFDAVMAAFREAGVSPRLALHAVGTAMLQGLVATGAGLTLASGSHSTRTDLPVVYRPLVDPELHTNLYAVWVSDDPAPVVREFVAATQAAAAGEEL
jgi:DNA-binding transcriptional LysR family regulator